MHKPLRLAVLIAGLHTATALAQIAAVDIPAQSLAGALNSLARQSGIQILFNPDDLKGLQAPAVNGQLDARAALQKLLSGSGFQASAGNGSYVIQRAPAGQSTLPEVLVTASAEPGYKADKATIAGKLPLSPREIPNSVSVLTREQMNDQDMLTITEAMQQVTGINVIANDTLSNQYYARGYGLGVMYDGITSYNGMTPSHQFDLPLYERIEVLRGPAGLLRGVGEPGGVVNLVKKKPKEDFAASWATGVGSWDTYRAEGDITGALNEQKSLLGRLVVADEDRGYFYDHTHSQKWLFMGALQFRLSPQTTFDLSLTEQKQTVRAPWSGLPTSSQKDANGHFILLDVPRSTFHVPDWGRMMYDTKETAFSVEHRFDNEWTAKASLNHRDQRLAYKYLVTSSTGVNPVTNLVDYRSMLGDYNYVRDGVDLYAGGPFQFLGRKHNFLLGFNAENYRTRGQSGSGPNFTNIPFGDLSSLIEPDIAYTSSSGSNYAQHGLYSQLRLSLADPLTLVLGGRTTTFKAKSRSGTPAAPGSWGYGARASNEITPYGGLLYDVSKEITLYASYADIFVPQTQPKSGGGVLDPRVGGQYEIGSKGEFLDGKLGASLAFFDIRDKNRAYQDPADLTGTLYLNAGEIESKGWETEITGKPMRGLDLSAGYTYLTTRYLKDRNSQGKTYSIQTPNNQFKFWGNYRFAQDSSLAGVSAGLGLFYQGKAQSSRGWRDEVVNDAYTVVNGRIAYQIDKNYSLSLLVTNLFDKKYYASVGTPNIYNFYGEPRSFMLTLRGSY